MERAPQDRADLRGGAWSRTAARRARFLYLYGQATLAFLLAAGLGHLWNWCGSQVAPEAGGAPPDAREALVGLRAGALAFLGLWALGLLPAYLLEGVLTRQWPESRHLLRIGRWRWGRLAVDDIGGRVAFVQAGIACAALAAMLWLEPILSSFIEHGTDLGKGINHFWEPARDEGIPSRQLGRAVAAGTLAIVFISFFSRFHTELIAPSIERLTRQIHRYATGLRSLQPWQVISTTALAETSELRVHDVQETAEEHAVAEALAAAIEAVASRDATRQRMLLDSIDGMLRSSRLDVPRSLRKLADAAGGLGFSMLSTQLMPLPDDPGKGAPEGRPHSRSLGRAEQFAERVRETILELGEGHRPQTWEVDFGQVVALEVERYAGRAFSCRIKPFRLRGELAVNLRQAWAHAIVASVLENAHDATVDTLRERGAEETDPDYAIEVTLRLSEDGSSVVLEVSNVGAPDELPSSAALLSPGFTTRPGRKGQGLTIVGRLHVLRALDFSLGAEHGRTVARVQFRRFLDPPGLLRRRHDLLPASGGPANVVLRALHRYPTPFALPLHRLLSTSLLGAKWRAGEFGHVPLVDRAHLLRFLEDYVVALRDVLLADLLDLCSVMTEAESRREGVRKEVYAAPDQSAGSFCRQVLFVLDELKDLGRHRQPFILEVLDPDWQGRLRDALECVASIPDDLAAVNPGHMQERRILEACWGFVLELLEATAFLEDYFVYLCLPERGPEVVSLGAKLEPEEWSILGATAGRRRQPQLLHATRPGTLSLSPLFVWARPEHKPEHRLLHYCFGDLENDRELTYVNPQGLSGRVALPRDHLFIAPKKSWQEQLSAVVPRTAGLLQEFPIDLATELDTPRVLGVTRRARDRRREEYVALLASDSDADVPGMQLRITMTSLGADTDWVGHEIEVLREIRSRFVVQSEHFPVILTKADGQLARGVYDERSWYASVERGDQLRSYITPCMGFEQIHLRFPGDENVRAVRLAACCIIDGLFGAVEVLHQLNLFHGAVHAGSVAVIERGEQRIVGATLQHLHCCRSREGEFLEGAARRWSEARCLDLAGVWRVMFEMATGVDALLEGVDLETGRAQAQELRDQEGVPAGQGNPATDVLLDFLRNVVFVSAGEKLRQDATEARERWREHCRAHDVQL